MSRVRSYGAGEAASAASYRPVLSPTGRVRIVRERPGYALPTVCETYPVAARRDLRTSRLAGLR